MRLRLWSFAAALVCAASPAFAAQWAITPDPQAITWQGTTGGSTPLTGACAKFDGDISFDPESLSTSSVVIRIDTGSCLTGDTQKDAYIPQAVWFNVAAFPTATFEAKTFEHVSGDKYIATGTLTLKGISQPVILPFTLTIKDKEAHVMGETVLQRLDFNIGNDPQLSVPTVAGPDVKVKIDMKATSK
ncbi:MAG: YceI family protein [Parvibaculum sp.]|nr:YceI family protein [Parvibaculum sp.]